MDRLYGRIGFQREGRSEHYSRNPRAVWCRIQRQIVLYLTQHSEHGNDDNGEDNRQRRHLTIDTRDEYGN